MNFDLQVAEGAARRWQAREQERESNRAKMEAGLYTEVWDPERVQKRIGRLTAAVLKQNVARVAEVGADTAGARLSPVLDTIGLERIVGRADFLGMGFLELALAVARFVGRVNVQDRPGRTISYGTGFMVSPRLLLTNNHVLPTARDALHTEIEFDYQRDRFGRLLPMVVYGLEPETFFVTSEELDFTLVAVRETSHDGVELKRYGWSRLIEEQGKALLGEPLNIVQHPNGRPKEIVLRSNELVDLTEDFAHYVTDTEPGSSGSPVYNDVWDVVALHHLGVPKKENGRYVAKDGSEWRPGMDPNALDWVANEGIRVSSIVEHVKMTTLTGEQARLREEMLNSEPPNPLEAAAAAEEERGSVPMVGAATSGFHSWTIPLTVTVNIGTPSAVPGTLAHASGSGVHRPAAGTDSSMSTDELGAGAVTTPADGLAAPQEAISIDPDYGDRRGYDPNFLGTVDAVPLPRLSEQMKADAAVNRRRTSGTVDEEYVLPYHHFSVVMNKRRRLAYFTAVNIDGNVAYLIRRDPDRWYLDPRIDKEEQTGEDVYAHNPLDRGHLVRRLDPAWGATLELAKVANDDTFHFTNCSPQHEDFNQNKSTWAGLEDYVLDNAIAQDLRVSVFTGPVLDERDPPYRGVQLPRQYWKVVVMAKEGGNLSATAYLLIQDDLLQDLEEGFVEEFTFGTYKTYQVPVRRIEELTGLDFGDLKNADPVDDPDILSREALSEREIASYEDLTL